MQTMRKKQLTYLVALALTGFILALSGQAQAGGDRPPAPAAAAGPPHVAQDPKLRITTAEVKALFAEVYGDRPLIRATLQANTRFLLVDTRPLGRFEEGHVPGAIHMPPGQVAANIDKLPRDRMIIFYCGGLHCPLSSQAAEAARGLGLTNIRVWYEGDPGWLAADGYLITTTAYVQRRVQNFATDQNFLLVDTRPLAVHNRAFIPGSLLIDWANWKVSQGRLPRDTNIRLVFY